MELVVLVVLAAKILEAAGAAERSGDRGVGHRLALVRRVVADLAGGRSIARGEQCQHNGGEGSHLAKHVAEDGLETLERVCDADGSISNNKKKLKNIPRVEEYAGRSSTQANFLFFFF
jgi:hypothetical protein